MPDNPFDDFEDIIPDWNEPNGSPMPEPVRVTPLHAVEDPLDTDDVGTTQTILEEMIASLQAAKTFPLSQNVLVDRNAMIANLQRVAAGIPDEVRKARWMIREQEAFIARTNERARQLTEDAQSRSRELVSQSHVLAEAVEEANVLVRNAEAEARRVRLDAEDYTEDRLVHLENLFANLIHQVREARAEFHEARPAAPRPPV